MLVVVSETTLVPLVFSLPAAIAVMIFLVFHWRSMAGKDTPRSRRRIRRANTMIQLVLIVVLVYALSVVSPDLHPSRYVVAWIGVILLVLGTIGLALVDSVNNIRILNRDRRIAREETVEELRRLVPREGSRSNQADGEILRESNPRSGDPGSDPSSRESSQ